MYRGTTTQLSFELLDTGLDISSLKEIWVSTKDTLGSVRTYKMSEGDVFVDTADPEIKKIDVILGQEDTLAYNAGQTCVQIRMLDNNDQAYVTEEIHINIGDVIKGGVIE